MRSRLVFASVLALLLSLAVVAPALAQGEVPGKFILGGTHTIQSGESVVGDMGVAGGQVTIEQDGAVLGDIIVLGGNLTVAGRVQGDVGVLGGAVQLLDTAVVSGDVVSFGGTVTRAPGAVVSGELVDGIELDFPGWQGVPFPDIRIGPASSTRLPVAAPTPGQWLVHQFLRFLQGIAVTLALAGLALVIALFWPKGVVRIGSTISEQPALTLLVGLLTWVLAAVAGLLMIVTICLIPLALVLILVMVAAALLAWISAGWLIGRRLLAVLKIQNTSTVLEAASGTFLLVLIYLLVGLLPCVDFLFGLIVASLGMGAIVLTRFGTRPYEPGREAPATPEPLPPALPPAPEATRSADQLNLPEPARDAGENIASQTPEDR